MKFNTIIFRPVSQFTAVSALFFFYLKFIHNEKYIFHIFILQTNPLKRVLRLASSGNTDKVVLFVSTLLEQAHPRDLTALERLHISNLAVMSYTEQLLRATNREKSRLESKFL